MEAITLVVPQPQLSTFIIEERKTNPQQIQRQPQQSAYNLSSVGRSYGNAGISVMTSLATIQVPSYQIPSLLRKIDSNQIRRRKRMANDSEEYLHKRRRRNNRIVQFVSSKKNETFIIPRITGESKSCLYYSKRDLTLFAWRERMRKQSIALATAVNQQQLLRAVNGVPVVPSYRIVVFYRKVMAMSNLLTTDSVREFITNAFIKESHFVRLEGINEEFARRHRNPDSNDSTKKMLSRRTVVAPSA